MSDAALAAYAARIRSLKTFPALAAQEASAAVLATVRATAAAGVTQEGNAWPTKKDGGRALPAVAGFINVKVNGLAIILRLTGPYVYHHYAKGAFQRRILPDAGAGIPKGLVLALRAAQAKVFHKLMGT